MFPCSGGKESRTHIVGGCELYFKYMEERNALERRETDECDVEKFVALDR